MRSPAYEPGGELLPQRPSLWARLSFPYWPVDLKPIVFERPGAGLNEDDRAEAISTAMTDAVGRMVHRREYFLSAREAFKTSEGPAPLWWHYVHAYVEHLEIARAHSGVTENARRPWLEKARAEVQRLTPKPVLGVFGKRSAAPDETLAKAQKELARLEAQRSDFQHQLFGFDGFIAEAKAMCAGRDPWIRINDSDSARFRLLFERGRKEFTDLVQFRTPHAVHDLLTETLRAMATGDELAYRAMPPDIREYINTQYLLPSQGWHQMFGLGVDIQGNASVENEGNVMLLQLMYDDMIDWQFGDMGAFQFWISPADLAAGNWNRARATFECH
jgi:hypothetical protein